MSRIYIEKRDEVKAIFAQVPFRLVTGLPAVVRAMMVPYARAMKAALIPVKRSGLLRKSIVTKITVYNTGTAYGIVGPDRNVYGTWGGTHGGKVRTIRPANYSHLVDLGTKPHLLSRRDTGRSEQVLIVPKRGNRKPYYKSRKLYERFGRMHPGAKPHPFRTPALLAGKGASLAAGQAAVNRLIASAFDPTKPKVAA
jgi:hypothetical protein